MRVSPIVPNDDLNRIMHRESRGKPNAKASTSTATGLNQFLEQTWFEMLYRHGTAQLAQRIRKGTKNGKPYYTVPDGGGRGILDMRKAGRNKALLKLNIDMGARFAEDNISTLGTGWNIGDVYLSHFAGAGTAHKCLRASPDTPAAKVFSAAQVNANASILRGKTCGQVRAWAKKVMTEWDRDGKPDYVAMYYPDNADVIPLPTPKPPEAYDDKPPVKIDPHLPDDAPEDEPAVVVAPGPATEAPEAPEDAPAPTPIPPAPTNVPGDPDTYWIQTRLKAMNYYTGLLDGKTGGKLFGAITGFVTDWDERDGDITPPKSDADYFAIRDAVRREITYAWPDFRRPVTKERADADPEVIRQVAPEVATQKKGFLATVWGAIVTTVVGIWTQFADAVSKAFNWIMGNKDTLPDQVTQPSWIWAKLSALPPIVWFMGAAGIFLIVALVLIRAVHKTVDDVRTGRR